MLLLSYLKIEVAEKAAPTFACKSVLSFIVLSRNFEENTRILIKNGSVFGLGHIFDWGSFLRGLMVMISFKGEIEKKCLINLLNKQSSMTLQFALTIFL